MQEVVAILDQLFVKRIEEPLIDRLGIAQRRHVLIHLLELLREIGLLRAFELFESVRHGLLEILEAATQSAKFLQDLRELLGVVAAVLPPIPRQSLLSLRAQLLHRRGKFVRDLDFHRRLHSSFLPRKNLRTASTNPGMSCRRASTATSSPRSRAVFEVTGPMLATCIFAGHGNPSARKFSTVDELVKVIRSAPS